MEQNTNISVQTKGEPEQPDLVPLPVHLTGLSFRQFVFELFSRFTSRKLWAFILSCAICWGCLERGVNHLYALQVWQAATYGGMFLSVMGAIATMACKYMGVEKVSYAATSSVAGSIASSAQHVFERRDENVNIKEERVEKVVHEYADRYKDDPSYRPIEPDTEEVFR